MKAVVPILLLLAVGLAGCTGNFDVKQTEPLRIRLEGDGGGGTSQTSTVTFRVDETQARERTVVVEKTETTERIIVDVTVRPASTNQTNQTQPPPTVIVNVIVKVVNGETLAERRVEVQPTAPVTQQLNVNVKGKNNVVVITQAVQGTADVDISGKAETA